jgi:hypothetical protein
MHTHTHSLSFSCSLCLIQISRSLAAATANALRVNSNNNNNNNKRTTIIDQQRTAKKVRESESEKKRMNEEISIILTIIKYKYDVVLHRSSLSKSLEFVHVLRTNVTMIKRITIKNVPFIDHIFKSCSLMFEERRRRKTKRINRFVHLSISIEFSSSANKFCCTHPIHDHCRFAID